MRPKDIYPTAGKTVTTLFEKTKLSAMANCAERLGILLRIESKLQNNNTLFGISIRQAIEQNQPSHIIIDTLKDAIRDNEASICGQLGYDLVQDIKCL